MRSWWAAPLLCLDLFAFTRIVGEGVAAAKIWITWVGFVLYADYLCSLRGLFEDVEGRRGVSEVVAVRLRFLLCSPMQ